MMGRTVIPLRLKSASIPRAGPDASPLSHRLGRGAESPGERLHWPRCSAQAGGSFGELPSPCAPCRLAPRARSRQTPAALMEHLCQNPSPAPQKPAPALPQKAAPKAAPSDVRHFPPSPWLGAEEHTRTMSQTEPNQTFIHPGQQVPRRSRPQVSQTREQQQQKACPSSSSLSPSCNKTRVGGSPHIATSHAGKQTCCGRGGRHPVIKHCIEALTCKEDKLRLGRQPQFWHLLSLACLQL